MSTVRFLFDEDVPRALLFSVIAKERTVQLRSVGTEGGPAKGTTDEQLLMEAEKTAEALITRDAKDNAGSCDKSLGRGPEYLGSVYSTARISIPELVESIILIWAASEAEEWQDRIEYLPWSD